MSREVLAYETALTLFSKRFLQQVVLHAHLGIHALQTTVLFRHIRSRLSRTNGVQRSLSEIKDASMPPNLARHL